MRRALTKLAAYLPDRSRRYLLESGDGIEALSSKGGRTLELVAQAWFEQRVLQFDDTAPIGSGRAHRNELDVYFFEINPVYLAPYVIGHERTFFGELRTFRVDRIADPRIQGETYTIPHAFVRTSSWRALGASSPDHTSK